MGSYGIDSSLTTSSSSTSIQWDWNPLFIGTVTPVTTSLRGAVFHDYIQNFVQKVLPPFKNLGNLNTFTDGVYRCP